MQSGVEMYVQNVKGAMNAKNLEEFLCNIGGAEAMALDTEQLAEIAYTKATGLYLFRRYEASLKAIQAALELPQSERNYIRLMKAKANIFTYSGKYRDSLRVLKELLTKTSDEYLLSEINLNMAWTYLTYYRSSPDESILEEAKLYLDDAYESVEHFDHDEKKRIVYVNYAEYFKLKREYDMAIEMIEESLKYCSEEKRAKVYNDIAELYLARDNEGDMETAKNYLRESEALANKHENDFDIANSLFIRARIDLNSGDYIKVLDSLYTACDTFLEIGSYSLAFDCYMEIVRVANLLKNDCVHSVKEKIIRQLETSGFKELL